MCKEISNLLTRKIPIPPHPNPLPRGERGCVVGDREMWRMGEGVVGGGEREEAVKVISDPKKSSDDQHYCHNDEEKWAHLETPSHGEHLHQHHLHDDIVSLAHRSHDHQLLPLMQNQAPVRAHSCHAGDGHGHVDSGQPMISTSGSPPKPLIGSGGEHHHDHGSEVEHCPNCDDHMDGDSCKSCGYHEHPE